MEPIQVRILLKICIAKNLVGHVLNFYSVNYGCLDQNDMRLQADGEPVNDKKNVCLPQQFYWVSCRP